MSRHYTIDLFLKNNAIVAVIRKQYVPKYIVKFHHNTIHYLHKTFHKEK